MPRSNADLDIPRQPPELADGVVGGDGYPFKTLTLGAWAVMAHEEGVERLYAVSRRAGMVGSAAVHSVDLAVKFLPPEFQHPPPGAGEV